MYSLLHFNILCQTFYVYDCDYLCPEYNVLFCIFVNVGTQFYKVGKYVIGRILHNKIKYLRLILLGLSTDVSPDSTLYLYRSHLPPSQIVIILIQHVPLCNNRITFYVFFNAWISAFAM